MCSWDEGSSCKVIETLRYWCVDYTSKINYSKELGSKEIVLWAEFYKLWSVVKFIEAVSFQNRSVTSHYATSQQWRYIRYYSTVKSSSALYFYVVFCDMNYDFRNKIKYINYADLHILFISNAQTILVRKQTAQVR
jgi:hypothetical protein